MIIYILALSCIEYLYSNIFYLEVPSSKVEYDIQDVDDIHKVI